MKYQTNNSKKKKTQSAKKNIDGKLNEIRKKSWRKMFNKDKNYIKKKQTEIPELKPIIN